MYNTPYFIPPSYPNMMIPNLTRNATKNLLLNNTRGLSSNMLTKKTNILSRLGSSISGIKTVNWSGLINNTSKTLGIINQTIPLVRQVGPVVTNMKSMLKVASLFKDETNINTNNHKTNSTPQKILNQEQKTTNTTTITTKNKNNTDESPTFFINTQIT